MAIVETITPTALLLTTTTTIFVHCFPVSSPRVSRKMETKATTNNGTTKEKKKKHCSLFFPLFRGLEKGGEKEKNIF